MTGDDWLTLASRSCPASAFLLEHPSPDVTNMSQLRLINKKNTFVGNCKPHGLFFGCVFWPIRNPRQLVNIWILTKLMCSFECNETTSENMGWKSRPGVTLKYTTLYFNPDANCASYKSSVVKFIMLLRCQLKQLSRFASYYQDTCWTYLLVSSCLTCYGLLCF